MTNPTSLWVQIITAGESGDMLVDGRDVFLLLDVYKCEKSALIRLLSSSGLIWQGWIDA